MATYKDSPWFVAENLTNQNSFRMSNFWSNNAPSGYQTVHAGSQVDWNAFKSAVGSGSTISLHNITWKVAGGPYASEAQAQAAIPGIQKKNPAPGALQQAGALSGLEAIAKILGDIGNIISSLFNPAMWISLGWLGLGAFLLIGGVLVWNKGTIAKAGEAAAFL